jgi:DNA repair protein RadC
MAKKFVEPQYDVYKVDEVDLVLERDFYIVGNNLIGSSRDAAEIFRQFWNENLINIQEQFSVMLLSQSNKVIGMYQHSKGAINSTIADVELIAAVAVKSLAKGVIVAHNHPSGALTPSQADITLTKRLKQALGLFTISLVDSMIIVQDKTTYYSLADNGDFADGGVIIGDNSVKEEYIIKDGATKEESIEYLIKRKENILNKVNPLIKKHKKLYSNMDISSSKSIEEKKSEKEIQDLLSEANEIVFKIRKMQKQVSNRSKMA